MPDRVPDFRHDSHNYTRLIRRWRKVARAAGTKLIRWGTAAEYPLFALKTKALGASGGIYLSAGIHGDEPAAPEALITWAEANGDELARLPLLIFPCLNPWGLVNNIRLNENFVDLNRLFHDDSLAFIRDLKALATPYRFSVAVLLHEDYDGQGVYIYEIKGAAPHWGDDLLRCAQKHLPIEGRPKVEGRASKAGLILRRLNMKLFARMDHPEAIWLHRHQADRVFTIETPSEHALPQRVAAHVAMVEECVRRARGRGSQ